MINNQISKEDLQQLPLLKFEGKIHLIDSTEKIYEAVKFLRQQEFLGFDTEKRPSFKRGEFHPTALVQLSTREDAYLFQVSKTGVHPQIKEILENASISKIGISIRDDLSDLNKLSPFSPAGFIDLHETTKSIGIKKQGVRNLSGIILGRRVSKNQQTSNWANEELTEAQMHYAALDAWVCAEMYYQLLYKGYIR